MKHFKTIFMTALAASFLVISTTSEISRAVNAEVDDVKVYTFKTVPTSYEGCLEYTARAFYGDSYFNTAPTTYNPHLATISTHMAACSFPAGDITKMDREVWYQNQPANLKAFYETLGFKEFKANEDYYKQTTFDTIGVGAANKQITLNDGKTYTLIACTPRSGQYFAEWANNFYLGDGKQSDYMHEGWYNAANKEIEFLQNYVKEFNISGHVKLWLSGFSRGGAVANITAALLDNMLDKNEKVFGDNITFTLDDLYAYTTSAPQGANVDSKTVKAPKDALYNNIWNIINPNDIVPKVAMSSFGFTRFGRDKYIQTSFYSPDKIDGYRDVFSKLYYAQDPEIAEYKADDFEMHGMSIENFGLSMINAIKLNFSKVFSSLVEVDYTKANYDANIVGRRILDELCDEVGSRQNYADDFQDGFKDLFVILFGDEDISIDILQTLMSVPGAIASLVLCAVGYAITESDTFLELFFTLFGWTMPEDLVRKGVRILAPLLTPLCNTYWDIPNEIISTVMFASNVMQNHNSEVIVAHLEAQDSYYIDDYNSTHEDKISLVPLFDNADYGRMKFFGFNDLGLRLESKKGERVVSVDGHVWGKSDVKQCRKGYAVGYYSYVTEEKMELYFPVGRKYNISMKDYSKKPVHRVEYWAYYMYFTIDSNGVDSKRVDHMKKTAYFNSDRYKRDVDYSR